MPQFLEGSMPTGLPQAIIFDLDDTLYLERDFVMSGFHAVASWVSRETGVLGFDLTCQSLFNQGQRSKIFDTAVSRHELPIAIVDRLIEIYRNHSPNISLAPDAANYLARAPKTQKYGLITDGHLVTQLAKIRSLKLEPILDFIVCTDAWGKAYWKPHSLSFETIERHFNLNGASLAYVADNPSKDFMTPKSRGWRTVQICRRECVNRFSAPDDEHRAHASATSLLGLDSCLRNIVNSGAEQLLQ
jgi:putative hydrolase of the HAD superfamily